MQVYLIIAVKRKANSEMARTFKVILADGACLQELQTDQEKVIFKLSFKEAVIAI